MTSVCRLLVFFLFATSVSYAQISSPVLTDARLAKKRQVEAGVGYSAFNIAIKGDRLGLLNSLDFQGAYGLSEKINVVVRYQHSWFASEMFQEWSRSLLSTGVNISLKEDRVSLLLPLGTQFTDPNAFYLEFAPTLMFSIPLTPEIAINPAIETSVPFCDGCSSSPVVSADLGIGIYPVDNVSFFAEYCIIYRIENIGDYHYNMYNLGVSFRFGKQIE